MVENIIHEWPEGNIPERVVVLGKSGFVASSIIKLLTVKKLNVVGIGSDDIDLLKPNAAELLNAKINDNDVLIFVSSIAPSKTRELFLQNMKMVEVVCSVLENKQIAHVVNISSDAVYKDDGNSISENSPVAPDSLHGMTHAAREMFLRSTYGGPTVSLRPSLLYGHADPHNGYGPNRFQRLAEKNEVISLFGAGEEKRDHVFIEDLAELVFLSVTQRSKGVLNIATGHSASFRETAELAIKIRKSTSTIKDTERNNPIVHRHFDIDNLIRAFPKFKYTLLRNGLNKVILEQQ